MSLPHLSVPSSVPAFGGITFLLDRCNPKRKSEKFIEDIYADQNDNDKDDISGANHADVSGLTQICLVFDDKHRLLMSAPSPTSTTTTTTTQPSIAFLSPRDIANALIDTKNTSASSSSSSLSSSSSSSSSLLKSLNAIFIGIVDNEKIALIQNHRRQRVSVFALSLASRASALVLDSCTRSLSSSSSASASASSLIYSYVDSRSSLIALSSSSSSLLSHFSLSLFGLCRSLVEWSSTNTFCSQCKRDTRQVEGGVKRKCESTILREQEKEKEKEKAKEKEGVQSEGAKKEQESVRRDHQQPCKTIYPRTDPVQITLCISSCGSRVLLVRKSSMPAGWYTCVSGFMDAGETPDDAVYREVKEETGVDVREGSVIYKSTQPWPLMGGQLMIGSHCVASPSSSSSSSSSSPFPVLTVDEDELSDAIWATFDQVHHALQNSIELYSKNNYANANSNISSSSSSSSTSSSFRLVPPPFAIAHYLIRQWHDDYIKIKSSSSAPAPTPAPAPVDDTHTNVA